MSERVLTNAYWMEVGAVRERERIIALLESEVWDAPEIADPYVRHITALIKGESKVKEINDLLGIIGK